MSDKKHTYGQFETPADVADLLLAFCLRQPKDRLLDPSCGAGAFLKRAALLKEWRAPGEASPDTLWGVELDDTAAEQAQLALPEARIINRNFFELEPWLDQPFDAIVGNPPYTRAEWIGRMPETTELVHQLSMFNGYEKEDGNASRRTQGTLLARRSGLHAYFFIHGTDFLREGGRFGFVVPNSWLDVAYGERLKQFLLDHYQILALIESNVERWFSQAKINTCLIILEKCSDARARSKNRVRLVRLCLPLDQLIPFEKEDDQRLTHLEHLSTNLLPGSDFQSQDLSVRVMDQHDLAADEKWGIALRSPEVYRKRLEDPGLVRLGSWALIQRGYTTGANSFFYLDEETVEKWEIETRFRRPLLKSLRNVHKRNVGAADCEHQVLYVPPWADLKNTNAAKYIAWGESLGFHQRRTCVGRQPWYSLPEQAAAQILFPKGIWERHFAPVARDQMTVDQQIYQIRLAEGIRPVVAAALLNSAWFALQAELHGRVNFGEGVLWLATYELEEIYLPDPQYLTLEQTRRLAAAYEPLSHRPVVSVGEAMSEPGWHAFNGVVFEIMGFSSSDAGTVMEALLERVATRRMKAGKPA